MECGSDEKMSWLALHPSLCWGWLLPVLPAILASMPTHYCVMLSLCSARHILDPREQVGTFELLGAQPVTDRDTFPEFVLGAVFPRKDVLIFFNSFQAADGNGLNN